MFPLALSALLLALIFSRRFRRIVGMACLTVIGGFALIVFTGNVLLSTPRNVGHRTGLPDSAACKDQASMQGRVLALASQDIGADTRRSLERAAGQGKPNVEKGLRCMLQTHFIPRTSGEAASSGSLPYHMAFLEYQENGNPQDIERKRGSRFVSQLDALREHLEARKSNYVVAFVHGWRHDASLGDDNVENLHRYAAHAARYISERQDRFPDTEVTAVFVGWPGARVDEARMRWPFDAIGLRNVGDAVVGMAAGFTLFDRKPISENVAPYALSALRRIQDDLVARGKADPARVQKLIVFGHSLGGNLLITALGDHVEKEIEFHKAGTPFPPQLGNLVVLINPAAEAEKWTRLQRAVWKRIEFRERSDFPDAVKAGHDFFPKDQKPVLISVTAARYWPAGGIRQEDLIAAESIPDLKHRLDGARKQEARGFLYDFPTLVLFPAFRFDFRPAASALEGWARKNPKRPRQDGDEALGPVAQIALGIADRLRYFPFNNTDFEKTRTIGHLDPPRPSYNHLLQRPFSEAPFGTTHEMAGLEQSMAERLTPYHEIGFSNASRCDRSDGWLAAVRKLNAPHGHRWDTAFLRNPRTTEAQLGRLKAAGVENVTRPAVQFVHGFVNSGRDAITRANDPFWNIRAYDNVVAKHNGYVSSPFVCAMQQLVLDEIVRD